MKNNIREYAKLGLVHHLLYPESTKDPDFHVTTLLEFTKRVDMECFDCCIPFGAERREKLIPAIRDCGKEKAYALHLFPLRKIPLASLDPQEQAITRLIIEDQISIAAAVSATGLIFGSGTDIPENRGDARKSFENFLLWLCPVLAPHEMTALIEPFDRDIDKKFLFGPIAECVELLETLSGKVDNIGIELDVAHLPLMGEKFEDAIRATSKYSKRIHLGNCILKDKSHPLYGDYHPPIGIKGGEIDVPELALILQCLLETGYLNKIERKPLLLEMTPFPGKSAEFTITDSIKRLEEAWRLV